MRLTSNSIENGTFIDAKHAFGRIDADEHMVLSNNLSPHLSWEEFPERTQSFALICVDPDVPSSGELVNREDAQVPTDLPRCEFFHWLMVNIPLTTRELAEGLCADEVTVGGKQDPQGPEGSLQGLNGYTDFFAGSDMAGEYHGYDGPCPPWNDDRMHHYHFTVFALDVAKIDLDTGYTGPEMIAAIRDHIIDQASLSVRYSLNPALDESQRV